MKSISITFDDSLEMVTEGLDDGAVIQLLQAAQLEAQKRFMLRQMKAASEAEQAEQKVE